ncbi:MAG TPA: carboxypeptidase-like regulatory domain-containing protein [Candidatus Thermoplasmatota archaeon]|nr:carboxypeptidase-like regulatory domain-containing protein [Candidatus Thermoplasmatota archaeon]
MRLPPFVLAVLLIIVASSLAGCSSGSKDDGPGGDGKGLDVTKDTGGIRGLVVDQSVTPVAGAHVVLAGDRNTTSDDQGQFNFTGLAPGDYFLAVGKPGFTGVQVAATVVAGVSEPPIVKVLLERLSQAQPYLDHFKLDGFYECAQAMSFVTDTCDWVPRTAWDSYNESQGSPPPLVPRSAMAYTNTQYIDVPADTYSIIQEGFWTDENVRTLWIMVDATPIDAGCDCSDHYGSVIAENPAYSRIERFAPDGSNNTEFTNDGFGDNAEEFPSGKSVASRGFIPPQEGVGSNGDPNTWISVAQNFHFVVITTLFHNYAAPEGWTFETKDQYPVG